MTEFQDKRISIGSAVKALGKNRIGGYLIRFTDENRRDLYGEFFDAKTDLQIDDFPIKGIAALFHHGFNDEIGTKGIGRVDTVEIDDKGVWVEAILKEHQEYIDDIMKLVEKGVLGWSSGALPQAVRISDNGHIDTWPVIEASATHTPAMPIDTAISSVRSLKPYSLREAGESQPRGVTVSTDGGAVTSVHIEYDAQATSNTTATRNTTEHENKHIGEIEVNDKLRAEIRNALKMLDDDMRGEIEEMIEARLSQYVAMIEEKMADQLGSMDADAARAAEDEVIEEATAAVGDMEEEDEEEAARSIKALFDEESELVGNLVNAWMRGYHAEKERKAELARSRIEIAMAKASKAKGMSKKQQAGGYVGKRPGQANNEVTIGNNLRYAHLSASDMAFGILSIRAGVGKQPPMVMDNPLNYVSEEYFKHFAHKAAKEVEANKVHPTDNRYHRELSVKNWQAQKASVPFRADEINASDITAQGLEWVGDFWSNEVWEKARYNRLFDRLVSGGMRVIDIPKGSDSINVPTEGSDPVVYSAPQANDLDATNRVEVAANINAFGTGNVTLTPGQLMVAVAITTILEEDAVVNTGMFANEQMQTVALEHIDKAIINGDTTITTNNNINLNDGTPGTGISRPYYLVTDGFRHLPLVQATGQGRDGGATLSIEDFRLTLALIDGELRQRKDNLLFIIDPTTEMAALALAEIATDDVRRVFPGTIASGLLSNMYGVEVFTSGFLPLSGAAGTISGTPANNTVGSILLPYLPYWWFAYKRRITLETGRDIHSQADHYVLSMRFGLKARGDNAAAMTYNTTA